eukprot:gene2489-5419_t
MASLKRLFVEQANPVGEPSMPTNLQLGSPKKFRIDTSHIGSNDIPLRTHPTIHSPASLASLSNGSVVEGCISMEYPGWVRVNENLWIPTSLKGHRVLIEDSSS